MTIEPPKGLKMALLRSYLGIEPEWLEGSSKPHELKKLCFGLCFFHGLILERRGFGPVGWNNAYGFSEPDRDISRLQLANFLEDFTGVPYDALNYMVSEANYGGRVTDNQDRRAIVVFTKDFYTPRIMEEDYKFSVSGLYYAPPDTDWQGYIDFIKTLPISTTPEVFTLHSNAKLTAAINEGNYVLGTCLSMMSSFGGGVAADDDEDAGKAKTPEETFSEISAEMASRCPELCDIEAVIRKYPVMYEQCLNVVLHMELGKFNRLLNKIKSSCSNLGKAVKGLVVFSPELEAVGNGCLVNKIPPPWMGVSYPSLKPLSGYFDDFLARWTFMSNWCANGTPFMFWFSAYFFQQAFLTGVLQNFARMDKIPIDPCTWNYEVMKKSFVPEEHPKRGAYANGMYMAGARWDDDNMCIADSFPKVLWDEFSPMLLKPLDIKDDAKDKDKVYECRSTRHQSGKEYCQQADIPTTSFSSSPFHTLAKLLIPRSSGRNAVWHLFR
jgi:dynein heavy chain